MAIGIRLCFDNSFKNPIVHFQRIAATMFSFNSHIDQVQFKFDRFIHPNIPFNTALLKCFTIPAKDSVLPRVSLSKT